MRPGSGRFVIAAQGDRHLGCGAMRRIDARTAELKRMYVRPEARNRGAARAVLRALEDEARALGVGRLVLETGPLSICMAGAEQRLAPEQLGKRPPRVGTAVQELADRPLVQPATDSAGPPPRVEQPTQVDYPSLHCDVKRPPVPRLRDRVI